MLLEEMQDKLNKRTKINKVSFPTLIVENFPTIMHFFPEGVVLPYIRQANYAHELWVLFNLIDLTLQNPEVETVYAPYLKSNENGLYYLEKNRQLWISMLSPCFYAKHPFEVTERILPVCVVKYKTGKAISIWYQCLLPQFFTREKSFGWLKAIAKNEELPEEPSKEKEKFLRRPDIMIGEGEIEMLDLHTKKELIEGGHFKALEFYFSECKEGRVTKVPFAIITMIFKEYPHSYWLYDMNLEWTPSYIIECKESEKAFRGYRIIGWDDYLKMKAQKKKLLISVVKPLRDIGDFELICEEGELNKTKLQTVLQQFFRI